MTEEERKKQQEELHRLTFEQAMEKLEAIVSAMEQGGVPLDEMIAKFEEGAAIAAYCQGKLSSLKKKMEILVKDRDGKASWQEMEGA